MGDRHIWAATALLVGGVCLVATTAETGSFWWAVGGYLCLLLVPALIVDGVVCRLGQDPAHPSRPATFTGAAGHPAGHDRDDHHRLRTRRRLR